MPGFVVDEDKIEARKIPLQWTTLVDAEAGGVAILISKF